MENGAHVRPYIVDEAGNPVWEIPRSTASIFYRYETRIVDRMPVPRRPRSKSTMEKLKDALMNPPELLRIPGDILKAPRARPVSLAGAPRGEGRYYYVYQAGRVIETTVTRIFHPPGPCVSGGSVSGAFKVAKDKVVVADAAERLNNAALFARIGSGGASGSSGAPAFRSGTHGASLLGSGSLGGPLSGMGTSSGFSGGSSLFDW